MGEMEDKLSAILNNPQMMSQIMSMAQAMGANSSNDAPPQPQPQPSAPKPPAPAPSLSIDPMMLQKLSGFAGQGAINKEQQVQLYDMSEMASFFTERPAGQAGTGHAGSQNCPFCIFGIGSEWPHVPVRQVINHV